MRAAFAVFALCASLSPAAAMDLPNLWFPEEFTGAPSMPVVKSATAAIVKSEIVKSGSVNSLLVKSSTVKH